MWRTVAAAKARRNSAGLPDWPSATMVEVTDVPTLAPMTSGIAWPCMVTQCITAERIGFVHCLV